MCHSYFISEADSGQGWGESLLKVWCIQPFVTLPCERNDSEMDLKISNLTKV